jgi:hypothetical protein
MKSNWMRWMVCGGAAAVVAVQATVAQEAGAGTNKTAAVIGKAKTPMVVDGKLDEADWQTAQTVPVQYVYGNTPGVVSPEPRMNVRYLWDDGCLYIGYDVFDTNLVAMASGRTKGPPENQRPGCEIWDPANKLPVDVVEFFVIAGDNSLFWELHHNAANQFNDLLVIAGLPAWQKNVPAFATPPFGIYWAKNEFLQDEGDRKLAFAVTIKPRKDGKPSTVNDSSDEDTGYTAELRVPWYGLGTPAAARTGSGNKPWKMGGREIAILAVSQNGDLKERYTTSATNVTQKKCFFHTQADQFPRYTIVAE